MSNSNKDRIQKYLDSEYPHDASIKDTISKFVIGIVKEYDVSDEELDSIICAVEVLLGTMVTVMCRNNSLEKLSLDG